VKSLLIVNPGSGDGEPDDILAAARALGVETHVLSAGDDPAQIARATDAAVLGVAGGDGSLAAVAEVAIERDLPLVCVPAGTRNHFARDLGLDREDPASALDAFQDGAERRVDVGRVNDRLFLNNVSLGVYATLVHRRERHRRRREALARLRAIAAVTGHRGDDITVDGVPVDAPVVLIANNAYDLSMLSLGERARLDEGRLHLYAAHGLIRSAWTETSCTTLTIDAHASRLQAAIDGEPDELETPLSFGIEPQALRVLVPRNTLRDA
jgi:diacylglycerol kinase family enzyme